MSFFNRIKRLWDLSKQEPESKLGYEEYLALGNETEEEQLSKKRGAIYMPKTDVEEAREEKIAFNRARGKDTLLSELD